ncbi:MAG: MBL fold metallo-hydrolase [ANME-2 cluster archaeon]|nr:MBL fold metallo-hydrolase [ANME-2 cluster archaeon]
MDHSTIHDLGIDVVRLTTTRKTHRPHVALSFDDHVFAVDTTRTFGNDPTQPDAYLITHAHSDHHGKSAMLSNKAICSKETARALEIRFDKEYMGRTFQIGETIDINGIEVTTHPTHHTIGSCAFSWQNGSGTRILVTGDVKDATDLPGCDFLVTEANYGDPADMSCYFEDDIAGLEQVIGDNVALGAYAFGKAQRAVSLVRSAGWQDEISMDTKGYNLTKGLMCDCGPLKEIIQYNGGYEGMVIVPPWDLGKLPGSMKKYVLTGRQDYYYPAIHISDHMDVTGLVNMVMELQPEATLIYHPDGHRPLRMANHLNKVGCPAAALSEI